MKYNFAKDLKDGTKGEQVIRHFAEDKMGLKYIKGNSTKYYDLLFQDYGEDPTTIEVKTDLWEKDNGSGNMVIEFKNRGKPSGLSTTKATYFVYYLVNVSDKQIWVIETSKLKELIKDNNFSEVLIGEKNYYNEEKTATCWLLPRFKFQQFFNVYSFVDGGWIKEMPKPDA